MKKLLAFLLAMTLVFSTVAFAFADEEISESAQICLTLGMLKGDGNGVTADYLATTPNRLQTAVMFLRLKGLEETALAYTSDKNFADADQVAWEGGRNIMAYLYNNPDLGWVGDGGNFNPTGVMTAQAYYKVMLEALGYKQNTATVMGDFLWANVIDFAAEHGLKAVANVETFTVNDLATATVETLQATVKGAETTLVESLVADGIVEEETAIEVGLVESELQKAIKAAEEAIAAIPAVEELTLDDEATVTAAADAVDAVIALDPTAVVEGADVVDAALAKITELQTAESDRLAAIDAAVTAIKAIPATVTLADKAVVDAAKAALDAALALDAEAVIEGADLVQPALDAVAAIETAKTAADTALAAVPATATLADKAKVTAARTAVDAALALDATLVFDTTALVAAEAAIVVLETPLSVESCNATNLREVVITFNKTVDATEGKDATNYTVGGTAPAKAVIGEDGKTVTLTMSNANALGNYSSKTVVVKKAVGLPADATIANVSFKDTTVPYVVSVETIGPRTLKVTFSETMDEGQTATTGISVDNGTVAVDAGTGVVYTANSKTATIKVLSDLTEGSHTLAFGATSVLRDNALYGIQKGSVSFTHTKDTAPVTVEVVDNNETSVTLKFSKVVNNFDANANVYVTHTYNTNTNKIHTNDAVGTVTTTDGQTYVVNFTNPLAPGTSTIWIGYESNSATLVKDGYGNAFAATSFQVTTTADITAPTFDTVTFVSATSLEVTFSEEVGAAALTKTNYKLLDSDGDAIAITNAAYKANSDNMVITLTTGTMNGGNYTLEVKNVKDVSVAQNVMTTTTLPFSATDKVAPTVVDKNTGVALIQVKEVATNVIRVEFSEAMNADDITNKANWKLDGNALAADDTIEAVDGNKAVEITFDATVIGGGETLSLIRVRDAAGNYMENWSTDLAVVNKANIDMKEARVISPTQIQIIIEDTITGATVSDFEVCNDGNGGFGTAITPVGIATTIASGKTTITLTIDSADKIVNTGLEANKEVWVRTVSAPATPGAAAGAKNQYNTAVQIAAAEALDYVGINSFNTVTTDDLDANGFIDTITIDFNEDLYVASVSDADFTVEGYDIDGIVVQDGDGAGALTTNEVVLTLAEGENYDTDATPEVSLVGTIEDASRNANGTVAAVDATDAAAPVLVAAAVEYATGGAADFGTDVGDKLILTYSEKVYAPAAGWTDAAPTFAQLNTAFAFSGAAFGDGTLTSDSINTIAEASTTITITVAGAVAAEIDGAETITGKNATVKDVVDNTQAVGSAVTPTYTEQ